jgi:hypothetical protein
MATAKKRQAPQPVAVVPKKLTRKEKSVQNKVAYRKLQKEIFAKAKHKDIKRSPVGNALVIHGATPKPTIYDSEVGKKICLMFATDPNMSLLVLNNDPTLPTVWTFYEWLHDHPDFDKVYIRAREMWCDLRAAHIVTMSAQPLLGEVRTKKTGTDFKGNAIDQEEVKTYDNVDRTRLYVETQKWLLAKERPKKYGVQPIDVDDNTGLQDLLAQFRQRSAEIEGQ